MNFAPWKHAIQRRFTQCFKPIQPPHYSQRRIWNKKNKNVLSQSGICATPATTVNQTADRRTPDRVVLSSKLVMRLGEFTRFRTGKIRHLELYFNVLIIWKRDLKFLQTPIIRKSISPSQHDPHDSSIT